MSLTKKIAFNTFFQVAGKLIVTATSLVTIGYLTRYLGVAGYGDYTTIFTYVSFWAVLADFGFFWALVKEISKPGADEKKIFDNVITLKILFGIVVFLLCIAIGFLIPQYSWTVKIGIAIISASWFWMSLNSTYVGFFQSRLVMYKSVISEIVGRVVILIGVIWAVKFGSSFDMLLAIYIAGNFINFLLSFIFGSLMMPFKFGFDFACWKLILIESTPLAALSIIGLIHFKVDTIILSILKSPTDVGIYGVPYKILEIVILIPSIFMGNVFPVLNRYFHANDKRLNESIQKSFDFLLILGAPITAGLVILAWPLIKLVAGNAYLTTYTVQLGNIIFPAPRILEILAVAVGFTFVIAVFSNLLTIIGQQRKQVIPLIVITLINIVANLLLIPYFSYVGAAFVTCLTTFISLIWWYLLTKKYLHFELNYKIVPKVLLATLIMGVVLYFLKSFNVILVSMIAVVLYFICCLSLKIFDKSMVRRIMPNFFIRKGKNE